MREAIAGDLEFDPTYAEQRRIARYLLGIAINKLRGRQHMRQADETPEEIADALEKIGLREGILFFDDFHHAPACPSNNWSRMAHPMAPCSCGAELRNIRTRRR